MVLFLREGGRVVVGGGGFRRQGEEGGSTATVTNATRCCLLLKFGHLYSHLLKTAVIGHDCRYCERQMAESIKDVLRL